MTYSRLQQWVICSAKKTARNFLVINVPAGDSVCLSPLLPPPTHRLFVKGKWACSSVRPQCCSPTRHQLKLRFVFMVSTQPHSVMLRLNQKAKVPCQLLISLTNFALRVDCSWRTKVWTIRQSTGRLWAGRRRGQRDPLPSYLETVYAHEISTWCDAIAQGRHC